MAKKITFWYLLAGIVWITFSDRALHWFYREFPMSNDAITGIQSFKGLLFVLITGFLLYKLIRFFQDREATVNGEYIKLFDDNPNALFIYSRKDLGLIKVNKAAQLKYNLSARHLDEVNFTHLVAEKDVKAYKTHIGSLSTESPIRTVFKIDLQGRSNNTVTNRIHSYPTLFVDKEVYVTIAVDITREVYNEETINYLTREVRSKTNYLHSIVNLSQRLSMIRMDMEGRVVLMNPTFEKAMGTTTPEMAGRDFSDTLFEADRDLFFDTLQMIRKEKAKPRTIKIRHLEDDGTIHILEWEFMAIREEDGSIIEIQGVGNEVTQNEVNLVELAAYKDRLQSITSSIKDVIWSVDLSTDQYIFINSASKEVYGYPPSRFYLDHDLWRKGIHPEDLKKFEEAMQVLVEKGSAEVEYRYIHADGTTRHILDRAVVLYDPDGRPKVLNGIASDRTRMVESTNKIREYEKRLADLLESITDAFFAVDKKWRITFVNKKFENMFGVERDKVLGASFWRVFPDARELDHYQDFYPKRIPPGEVLRFEEFLPNWGFWIGVTVYPTPDGMAAYIQDLTEKKTSEEQILQQNEQLKEIAWIHSHGVRKHVANLMALLEILNKEALDDPDNEMVINKMEETVEMLDDLVRQIVVHSKVLQKR